MATIILGMAFSALLCAIAFRANARFRYEERLPMQWWLDGRVRWSAPRRIALAFIPAISAPLLIGLGVLLAFVQPRPGQDAMVISTSIIVGLLFVGAQLFHLWMVARTIGRSGG